MKRSQKTISFIAAIIITLCFTSLSNADVQNKIQIAILLDTSSSMDGLINQARSQIWRIINEFARAKRGGKHAALEVALYEYGNDTIPSGEGYIRMVLPLTTNLDMISEKLFGLQTNGGSEFCGLVLNSAVRDLNWSTNKHDIKLIFIAGNEAFSQGVYDYKDSCKNANNKNITVNTIFCGMFQSGIQSYWKHGSDLTNGSYIAINHNRKIDHIAAPQDTEILKLGRELNKTYIPYGQHGSSKRKLQLQQDRNAEQSGKGTTIERSISKAASIYNNSTWDLVDATNNGKVDIDNLSEDELRGSMRTMSKNERRVFVKKMQKRRKSIQERINLLNRERRTYIARKQKESANDTVENAIINTVRKQAHRLNYTFK